MENPFETLNKRLTGMEEMMRVMLSILPSNSMRALKENYLTTKEAGEYIKKTPNAIRQLVHKNAIPHLKRGSKIMFLESELRDWLESGRVMTTFDIQEDAESILLTKKKGTRI